MDFESVALALLVSGVAGSITGYLGALLKLRMRYASPVFAEGVHIHAFDTMLGDGKGWRCGIQTAPGVICGLRKESE